jgi:hypothetical protein
MLDPQAAQFLKRSGCAACLALLVACSPNLPRKDATPAAEAESVEAPDNEAAANVPDEESTAADSDESADTPESTEAETEANAGADTETETEAEPEAEPESNAGTAMPAAIQPARYFERGRPTIMAASCQFSAVQMAVRYAGMGSTVQIPAGDCDWGTRQLRVPAGIYLQGAGQDVTVIRRTGDVPNTKYLIAYDCSNGKQAIFSNMTLVGNGDGAIQDKGLGLLNGCRDFKVHDAKFTHFIFSAVYVGDAPNQRGVIYKNKFIDNFSSSLMNLGYGVVVYGGGVWPPLELGSRNAVFVEDNYFSGNRHNIASNNGSIYVFRHNTVVGLDPAKDFAMTDAHGLSSSPRGSRSFEIYNNTYLTNITDGYQRTAIGIRGGDGVIFNNIIAGRISRGIELMPEGFNCGIYPGKDQIRSVYIWNNRSKFKLIHGRHGVDNGCPKSIKLNRDYYLKPRPGYRPYPYPHPLRLQDERRTQSALRD